MTIQSFIETAASELGADSSAVRSATGGVLQMIQSGASGPDFQSLLEKLPGAGELLGKTAASGTAGGSALSSLTAVAGAALGGDDASPLARLAGSGLDLGSVTKLVPMFLDFAKNAAGPDLVQRLLSSVPALKNLDS